MWETALVIAIVASAAGMLAASVRRSTTDVRDESGCGSCKGCPVKCARSTRPEP